MAAVDYTTWLDFPTTQLRVEIDTEGGNVQRFIVQLEYDVEWDYDTSTPSDWRTVARFDHDPDTEFGHDATDEGLHLDIYRDGQKAWVERGFPPVPLNDAPAWCEAYLYEKSHRYVRRFERWHDVNPPRRP